MIETRVLVTCEWCGREENLMNNKNFEVVRKFISEIGWVKIVSKNDINDFCCNECLISYKNK